MCPMRRYPMVQTVFSPCRRSQQQTLALVIAALAEGAQAYSVAVAGRIAMELGTPLGRALTRCSRLRRHPRMDEPRRSAQLLQLLGRGPRLIARDGTAWPHDLRMLGAAVVVGGRAIPVPAAAFSKSDIPAVDRGWGWRCQHRAGQAWVAGVWAPEPREPWWWTTDRSASLGELVALDERRMAVAAPFRESTGGRLGVQLEGTPCRTPAYLTRLTLMVGVALMRWTAVGQAVAKTTPQVRLPSKRQGPRLSLLRVGLQCVGRPALLVYIGVHFIRAPLPRPRLRHCPGLQASEAVP